MKLGELFNSQTPTDRLEGWGKTGRNVKRCETHLCSLILSCQDCTSSPKPPVVTDMPYLESPKHLQLPAFSKGMPSPGSPSPTGSQFQECDAEMGSLPGTVSEDMFKAAANSLCRQQGFECLCFFTACNLDILYANIYIYIIYIRINICNLHSFVLCFHYTTVSFWCPPTLHWHRHRNRNCASHCTQDI